MENKYLYYMDYQRTLFEQVESAFRQQIHKSVVQ